ncbi:hypothetical protein PEBR_40277 [Penicillium brasilianum]|uniref:Uncharacterized protein n=1 Tax=Penicillium brasilianum TaxID=104259 RepID=A0A1S9RAM2_PENBI|nr:hypothetical protein PEBR_40277 [Penicillium brasilianum]
MCSILSSMEWILESLGARNTVQSYRWSLRSRKQENILADIVWTEYRLSKLAQREKVFEEIIQRQQNKVGAEKGALDMSPVQKEIFLELDQKSWIYLRRWWQLRMSLPDGPVSRGFELHRSNPKWYMHPVLVERCAGEGGCCSRDCGCCAQRVSDFEREHGAGHCVASCGCCRNARGFDLTSDLKNELDVKDESYRLLMLKASTFGLGSSTKGEYCDFSKRSEEEGYKLV